MPDSFQSLKTSWKTDIHLLVDKLKEYKEAPSNDLAKRIHTAKEKLCKELEDYMPLMLASASKGGPQRVPLALLPETPHTPEGQRLQGAPWSGYRRHRNPWSVTPRSRSRSRTRRSIRNNRNRMMNGSRGSSRNNTNNSNYPLNLTQVY